MIEIDRRCNEKLNPKLRRVIAWFSGGITSAFACYWAVRHFKNVQIIGLDTKNEDDDTYRFANECEILFGKKIQWVSNPKWESIEHVWYHYLSLNTAHGAICSTELKREMREQIQNVKNDYAQVFGFDASDKKEMNRHNAMRRNYPEINVISPNVAFGYSKRYCLQFFERIGIKPPRAYYLGFMNNNCLKTLCVKGGIGYWQMAATKFPDKFERMAEREHELTDLKGSPVTICKDQGKEAKATGEFSPVFLKYNPKYPQIKDISMFKGRQPKGLMECTGFCGTKD